MPERNGTYFAEDIFYGLFHENCWIVIETCSHGCNWQYVNTR